MNKLKSYITNWYFLALACLVFFLPLIYGSHTNELYEFPKMYFVYFFGAVLISVFLLIQIWKSQKLQNIPVYIKLYLLSFIVSTVFSMHTYTSVWGYYTRFGDCLMSTLVFFGIYLVAKSRLMREDFDRLYKIALFSLIPISILAISQSAEMTRVYSTFGQPNWLAQFLVTFILLANVLFLTDSFSPLWFVISVLGFIAMWFTYSLSGVLAYVVGFSLLLFLYRKLLFLSADKKPLYKIILLVVICELFAVTNLGVFKLRVLDTLKDVKVFQQASVVDTSAAVETTSTSRNLSDPGYIRGGLWMGTVKLIFSSPKVALIGTGPETFPYAFQPFRPKELNYSSEWNFVFNKPHNYILEIASEQGLLGLAIYLYLCWLIFKKLPKQYLPGFIAFFVTNLFGWTPVYMNLIFWLYLANLEVPNVKEIN